MQVKFLYFDLGKVLLNFSAERMLRQMADVARIETTAVEKVLFEADLQRQYETGRISSRDFYETFCQNTGSRPGFDELSRAGSDIFELNATMLPLVAHLGQAGYRLGILSNTCEIHWEYCVGRFRILAEGFQIHALSYRLGLCKPQPAVFHAAADLAGVEPSAIFFVDDLAEHVAAARTVGFDAVQYTSTRQLAADLRKRGIRFNY